MLLSLYCLRKKGLGLRFGHLGKLIVSTFYKKSYYFSMLHDMDKVLIKKVAETKINAPLTFHSRGRSYRRALEFRHSPRSEAFLTTPCGLRSAYCSAVTRLIERIDPVSPPPPQPQSPAS